LIGRLAFKVFDYHYLGSTPLVILLNKQMVYMMLHGAGTVYENGQMSRLDWWDILSSFAMS